MRLKKEVDKQTISRTRSDRELEAQCNVHNAGESTRPDEDMYALGAQRPKVRGKGAWKEWKSQATLRCSFATPAATQLELARQARGSQKHVGDQQCLTANVLAKGQRDAIARTLAPEAPHEYIISDAMFDGCKYTVHCIGHRSRPFEVLGVHGGLAWSTADGIEHEETVVVPPRCLLSQTASAMWNCLSNSDIPLYFPPECAQYMGTVICIDNNLLNTAPPNHFVLPCLCRQHATGNCMAPLTLSLNPLLNDAFCTVKMLDHGARMSDLRKYTEIELSQTLKPVEPFTPDEDDLAFSRAILEATYYDRDLTNPDLTEEARREAIDRDKKKRALGERLIRLVPNWRRRPRYHPCPAGCCGVGPKASKEKSAEKNMSCIAEMVLVTVETPALNKFTQVCFFKI